MKKIIILFFVTVVFLMFAAIGSYALTLNGYTKDNSSAPISGSIMTLMGLTSTYYRVTVSSGFYEFTGIPAGYYALTPSSNCWTFSPSTKLLFNITSDQTGLNFFGTTGITTCTVSGYAKDSSSVPISGVIMTLLGGTSTYLRATDGGGYYIFESIPSGSYILTPTKTGFVFSPQNKIYPQLGTDQVQNFFGTSGVPTYTINGYVKDASSAPIQGAAVVLTGDSFSSGSTDSQGYYEFVNLSSGNYMVAAVKFNWIFSPSTRTYLPLNSNRFDQNFFGTQIVQKYSISGAVTSGFAPVSGTTVTLSGDKNALQVTDYNGLYSFTDLNTGSYGVTPSKLNWTFNPSSQTVQNLNFDVLQDFNGTPSTTVYSIRGWVVDAASAPIQGVSMELSGYDTSIGTVDGSGMYIFQNLSTGTYFVTPIKANWSFFPSSRTYAPLNDYKSSENFIGTPIVPTYKINGFIRDNSNTPIQGVTVALRGNAFVVCVSEGQGYYEFPDLLGGNYSVAPTKVGWEFSPSSNTYTALDSDRLNRNFTGIPLYAISGYVLDASSLPLQGITISLAGDSSKTTQTDSSGFYQLNDVLAGGSYIITPSSPGVVFNPLNKVYQALDGNKINQDFTATASAVACYIKGYVRRASGPGFQGVTLTLTGGNSGTGLTSSSGYYEFLNLAPGIYTIMPSIDSVNTVFNFAPEQRDYNPLGANMDNQDFIMYGIGEQPAINLDTVKSAELHFGPGSAVHKKIKELKEKIQRSKQ